MVLGALFEGRSRSELKDWARAIEDYNQAIVLDAKSYWAHMYRGLALGEQGNQEKALADFTKAIELYPSETWPYQERGEVLLDKGKMDLAMADFYKIIEVSSSSPGYKLGAAVRKLEREKAYDVAITLWTKLIKKWPRADNYRRRAKTRESANDRKGALIDYSKAIEVKPDEQYGYTIRARYFRQLGEADSALADYDQALKLEGDSGSTFSVLKDKATLLLDMGRDEEARETYRQAILESDRNISNNSTSKSLKYDFSNRAYLRKSFEDYGGAVADLTSAIEIEPNKYYYKRRADILWARLGEYDRAQADFAKLLEIDPDYDWAIVGSGIVLYRQGKYRKARKALRNAVALKPASAAINNFLAFFYATCPKKSYRDPINAVEHAKIAVEKSSSWNNNYFYENLAFAYTAGEQFAKAVEAQKEAIKLYETKKTSWNINAQQRQLRKMKERLASYQAGLVWEGEGHPLEWRQN